MEGTEVQPLFIYIPVIGVVLCVVLVFACGFRSSTEPPSSMFEDENEKRNKRGRRKKVSTSELKPSTNGHVKLPSDSPREIKQVKGQKVEQDNENAPKVSPKKEKSAKSKSNGGKDEEIVKKPTLANGGAKDREKDEGDAWITVTAPRKDKKTNKQTAVQNGEPAKPTNKSPKVSPKSSGGEKAAQKGKKEGTAKNDGSKEAAPKQKGSPKKVVEDVVKASSVSTQSAKAPESPADKGKKRKKKGQPEGEETTNQTAENMTGLTNGSVEDSKLTNQKKEGGEAEDGFTPGKSRKNKKKQKTTQDESTIKTSPVDNKTQKSKASSPESSPAKSTKKSPGKPASPQNKATTTAPVEGSPSKSSKGDEAKMSSPSKSQKNTKKESSSPAKSDTKPLKDKKSTEKASSSATSSLDTSPVKSKSSSDSSPSKSSKKRGGEKTSTQQKKPDDKPLPDSSKSQKSTSPEAGGDAKSKTKKKSKKESTPSSPTTTSKQPATTEAVRTTDVKVDSVDVKTNGKKNKRKGGGETKGKPIDTDNKASHSLPPANAKDVSSAITPDRHGDKPPPGSPTPKPDKEPATVVAPKEPVPKAEDNDNWVEAKPVKKRKKVRRDL